MALRDGGAEAEAEERAAGRVTATMEAFAVVARQRDAATIAAACECLLKEDSWRARQAAVDILTRVARDGEVAALAGVSTRLQAASAWVRQAAVQALVKVAKHGDVVDNPTYEDDSLAPESEGRAVAPLRYPDVNRCYELVPSVDRTWDARQAAVEALGYIAARGDRAAVSAAIARLRDTCVDVRIAAMHALQHVAPVGDKQALVAALPLLKDPLAGMRRGAAKALGQLARRGDAAVTAALAAQLGDSEWEVRCAALQALGHVAEDGDPKVIAALERLQEDTNRRIAFAAEEMLQRLRPACGSPIAQPRSLLSRLFC